ncbi:hypothetical protein JQ559_04575 [Bradyrhizobium viridifuturi]|jgi:hypothetical protein|uniref:hypothetical protein n=2 Tax=Nitrobacteraceae TaxID=41294 RepID=UPI000397415B|nr:MULTISPECIES: hypothetical protein [Bradyrhizobium]ERF85002.1 MAG: cytidylate kinase [Bradyrhizobium sp. DFCI-1]OYU59019.1 MAG: hypothetical protein CFE30_27785 [Bradyrhizobium sp. PARBB1]PSO15791.1 hypothetical protein C7G43_33805 [Bradyrhizobium sp. MOS004]QRI67168.1 hypothetical protein JQ507_19425 [Bradyrhizobium sp. PSBB068]MBR1019146.1 hypothetical protein [Bradyrhizobium viridifuturi]
MKRSLIIACTLLWVIGAPSAFAQKQIILGPGGSIYNPTLPPPPPPPPPPKIEVPPIPKMDAVTQPNLRAPARSSFGDRVSRCLDEAAASGLNQSDRAAYSRSCANTRD